MFLLLLFPPQNMAGEPQEHGFYIRWLLISLCAPTIGLLEDSYEKIGNLEEGDLPIEETNNVQRIITFKIIVFQFFDLS